MKNKQKVLPKFDLLFFFCFALFLNDERHQFAVYVLATRKSFLYKTNEVNTLLTILWYFLFYLIRSSIFLLVLRVQQVLNTFCVHSRGILKTTELNTCRLTPM